MLPSSTSLRARLATALLLLLVGCQGPTSAPATVAPAAPTAAPVAPTPAPAATPAATSVGATRAPAAPTRAPASTSTPAAQPTAPAVGTSRVDTLNAADAAFGSGDLKTAVGLYDRVVNTPPGSGEGGDAGSQAINDFASFRAMVSLLADGQDDAAHTHLDELQKRDPSAPLARLGGQLYDQYGMTGQLRGACAQVQPQIATQAAPTLTTLQGLGVSVDATTLCTVKQS